MDAEDTAGLTAASAAASVDRVQDAAIRTAATAIGSPGRQELPCGADPIPFSAAFAGETSEASASTTARQVPRIPIAGLRTSGGEPGDSRDQHRVHQQRRIPGPALRDRRSKTAIPIVPHLRLACEPLT